MKSVKTLSIALLTVAAVGTQLNAMNGMAQSVPTKVPFGMRFMDRVRNGGIAQRAVFAPSFTMTSPEIQVQQELLDQSAGLQLNSQEVIAPVSFAQRAQAFAKNAFNVVSEKAQTFKSAVAQKVNAFGSVVAEKAKNAYHGEIIQNSLTKLGRFANEVEGKATLAMKFVNENPKLVAGIAAASIITTSVIYKLVSDFRKHRNSDVDRDEPKEQNFRNLSNEEVANLRGIAIDESILDSQHVAQMEAQRNQKK